MTSATTGPATAVHLEQISDGVFAYVQSPGGWCLNNAGIVLAGDAVVLVDTAATESRARALRRASEELAGQHAGIVVNTHSHGDHTFGNSVFADSATVVAQRGAATEIAANGLAMQGLWPDVTWGEVVPVQPDITFDNRMSLPVSGVCIELLHFGPGHTVGDAVVWLPERRVLFAGDLVFSATTPFALMGSIAGWLRVLDQLRALKPRCVVPGHGPVGGPELLDSTADYLRWVLRLARIGRAQGRSPLETARAADLSTYGQLLDAERLVGNLARAYAEEAGGPLGRPLDVHAAFTEMIEFHGGLPHCPA